MPRVSLRAQREHLAAADPVMAKLIDHLGELSIATRRRGQPKEDAYGTLLRAIVGQQVSSKAAFAIFTRVKDLFGGRPPTPAEVLATDADVLRGAGLSGRKVEYIRDLARHVADGELELDRLGELSDDEVVAEISAVRGLGVWSAHMFLIVFLERPDVLPVGDLGIRNAARAQYALDEMPTPTDLERIAESWRPYRTLGSIYLWGSLANPPAV
jgi:DNA-3-methyladenine glycosylase II